MLSSAILIVFAVLSLVVMPVLMDVWCFLLFFMLKCVILFVAKIAVIVSFFLVLCYGCLCASIRLLLLALLAATGFPCASGLLRRRFADRGACFGVHACTISWGPNTCRSTCRAASYSGALLWELRAPMPPVALLKRYGWIFVRRSKYHLCSCVSRMISAPASGCFACRPGCCLPLDSGALLVILRTLIAGLLC